MRQSTKRWVVGGSIGAAALFVGYEFLYRRRGEHEHHEHARRGKHEHERHGHDQLPPGVPEMPEMGPPEEHRHGRHGNQRGEYGHGRERHGHHREDDDRGD